MDALEEMLQTRYKLSPEEAKQSAARIHAEHSGEDNLQGEAYGEVAKNEISRMDRLRKNALLYTDIAKRKANGERLSPEHQSYFDQVRSVHEASVASRLRERTAKDAETQRRAGGSGGSRPYAGNPVFNTVRHMAGTQGIVNTEVAPVLGPPNPELQRRDGILHGNQPAYDPYGGTAQRDGYLHDQGGSTTPDQEDQQLIDLYQNQYPVEMPAMSARRKR